VKQLKLILKPMITKHLIRPERVRRIPSGFNWLDHRLVRLNYINRCDCPALALYLLLVTVADVQGLSYYSDKALGRRLKLSGSRSVFLRNIRTKPLLVKAALPLLDSTQLSSFTTRLLKNSLKQTMCPFGGFLSRPVVGLGLFYAQIGLFLTDSKWLHQRYLR